MSKTDTAFEARKILDEYIEAHDDFPGPAEVWNWHIAQGGRSDDLLRDILTGWCAINAAFAESDTEDDFDCIKAAAVMLLQSDLGADEGMAKMMVNHAADVMELFFKK